MAVCYTLILKLIFTKYGTLDKIEPYDFILKIED